MLRSRAALLLVAAPLAFGAPASADPTVPGCWGVGQNAYCDATVRVRTSGTGSEPTPVCAYSCVYVGVPDLRDDLAFQACLDYTTPQGYPDSRCVGDVQVQRLVDALHEAFCDRLYKPPDDCR